MNITQDFKNSLLKRREVSFSSSSVGNPGFAQVVKKIAEHFKVDENVVAVKELKGKFGTDQYTAKVFIYHSLDEKNLIEPKPKVRAKKEGTA